MVQPGLRFEKSSLICTGETKKETKLGITAKKSAGGVEFADWYTQVCTNAELISYYDVSGKRPAEINW